MPSAPFKTQPKNNDVIMRRNKTEASSLLCSRHPNLPRDTRVKVTLVARPLFVPSAQEQYKCKRDVFTSRMCVHSQTLLLHFEIGSCCSCERYQYVSQEGSTELGSSTQAGNISEHRKLLSVTRARRATKSWYYGRAVFKQCISCSNGTQLQELGVAIDVVLCVKEFMCEQLVLRFKCNILYL
jgi:hypothetical protein